MIRSLVVIFEKKMKIVLYWKDYLPIAKIWYNLNISFYSVVGLFGFILNGMVLYYILK